MNVKRLVALTTLALLAAVPVLAGGSGNDSSHAYLGVRLQNVEGGLAEALGIDEESAVLVSQVVDGSPANDAGLQSGDLIRTIGGTAMGTPSDVREVVRDHDVGDTIEVAFSRDGTLRTVSVALGESSKRYRTSHPGRHHQAHKVRELRVFGSHGFLGVSIQPIAGDLGDFFGVEEGALVSSVVEDSPAAEAGLKAGDVITHVAGSPVADPGDLRDAIRDFEEETEVEIVWVRDKREMSASATIEIREGPRSYSWGGPHDFHFPDLEGLQDHLRDVRVDVRAFDDDTAEELEELRKEMDDLRREMDKMRKETEKEERRREID